MPRAYPDSVLVAYNEFGHRRPVGYSLKKRANGPTYFCYFRGPDGKRLERDTGQTGIDKAREAARAIISREHAPSAEPAVKTTWDDARARLEQRMTAAGLRPRSVAYYLGVYDALRNFYPETDGPADISPKMAQTFADHQATAAGRWGRKRSGWTAATRINAASVLYHKWLVGQLEIVPANPFEDVDPPKRDKLAPKAPTADQIEEFHRWLSDRFPGWELPHLFFRTKARAGCRLLDLCSVRSDQLRGGRLHFDAHQMKGRKARSVPLPPDLFDSLAGVAGPTFLWQHHPAQLRQAIRAKGWPAHQLRREFDPARMAAWVMTLFADFNADHPGEPKLTSHQFRRKAFTDAYRAGASLDAAAIAFGCNPTTIRGHYLGVSEQEIADGVFAKLDAR